MDNFSEVREHNGEEVMKIISQLKTEIMERKWAEKKSRDALDYAESIIDSVKHPLVVLDESKKVISANFAFYDLFNLTPGVVLGQNFLALADGFFDFPEMKSVMSSKHVAGEGREMEIHREFNLIGRKYLKVGIQGLQYNIKHLRFSFLTMEDITEQKNAELRLRKALEDKSILVKEVHHRVKNNLQILSSLLALQITTQEDDGKRQVLEDGRSRVMAIAAVHESLSHSGSVERIPLAEPISRLVDGLNSIFDDDVQVSCDVCDATLGINQATLLCLILNEVLTNAHKHAFADQGDRPKLVNIAVCLEGEILTMTISDNGSGMGEDRQRILNEGFDSSLGFVLVRNLVENQLKGSWMVKDFGGLVHEIRFRLEEDYPLPPSPLFESAS